MQTILRNNDLDAAIRQYREDGATVLRGVVDPKWIASLSSAIDELLDDPGQAYKDFTRPGEGRFFGDLFAWLRVPALQDFILKSDIAQITGQLMQASTVRFFYDQLLVKEPNTTKRTPWHQDLPYWPARGEQIISLWVPIDAATPENGVVTYVKGSHRWNAFFPIDNWSDNQSVMTEGNFEPGDIEDLYAPGPEGATLADIRDRPERYEFLTWNVEPGDILVHHPLVVHGAPGNLSNSKRRRALATRWFGDDARWDDTRPHFMRMIRRMSSEFPYPQLDTGATMDDPLFPVVWQRSSQLA